MTCSSGVGSIGGGAGEPLGKRVFFAIRMTSTRRVGERPFLYKRNGKSLSACQEQVRRGGTRRRNLSKNGAKNEAIRSSELEMAEAA